MSEDQNYTVVGQAEGAPGRALLLVFHGSKQTGAKHRAFTGRMYDALAERGDAVVVYLDGYRGNWNDARKESSFPARLADIDHVGFAREVVDRLADSHGIDRRRVYAVGYSNGGQMVMRLIHETPDLIAGAAVLSATMPAPENFLAGGHPVVPMPVLLMHGTKDPIVAYEGGEMTWWARRMFKVGGRSLSAPETAAYFAERNGITTPPRRTDQTIEYRQEGRPPVVLYTLHGAGHTIAGPKRAPFVLGKTNQDLNTAELIADFLGLNQAVKR
ncbi:hypothetical protein JIG36_08515 [Actinoplanes sp. LDG1-06]|uniref:Phospholipase/carboxylesterase/thioesterase domain-containing protein n=1 Tax=Paractinoplanes ovalisporus TaxID=2810368 RepID=A0ABS2A8P2_9ACTN|nr:hypothetical protein [Actinoplanes ovalisporus]MBM2615606.1 hypothetical protein [Actinoplanes ovalisporus]